MRLVWVSGWFNRLRVFGGRTLVRLRGRYQKSYWATPRIGIYTRRPSISISMRAVFITLGLVIIISLLILFSAIAVVMITDNELLPNVVKVSYLALTISAILFVMLLLVYNPKDTSV
jgi:uncharacterized BrkB/YihY/UPF0761 family membrane protein